MAKKKIKQLDRFRISLAIVDVGGIIAFLAFFRAEILIYLLVFNVLVILVDSVRRGLIVRKEGETMVEEEEVEELEEDIPVDPLTGNRAAMAEYTPSTRKAEPVRIAGMSPAFAKKEAEEPAEKEAFAIRPVFAKKEKEIVEEPEVRKREPDNRDEVEKILEDWAS
ncbi:hypothetical protein HYS48_00640 [Candidatus Woesearchaeota archaeon]|nr:hypothetical protein [Candidatus Woesearchaeota archaeon]